MLYYSRLERLGKDKHYLIGPIMSYKENDVFRIRSQGPVASVMRGKSFITLTPVGVAIAATDRLKRLKFFKLVYDNDFYSRSATCRQI